MNVINVTNVFQVKSQLKEKLNELPTQEELQKKADSFIAQLPKYKVSFIEKGYTGYIKIC